MQVKCELAYNTSWEELDWEAVKKYHPLAPEEKPTSRYAWTNMDAPIRFTDGEMAGLALLGFTFAVVPYPGAMITKMEHGADGQRLSWDNAPSPADLRDARAVQITIPDMALMYIKEVTWLEDACTDDLQAHLDDGWRLLAVCPPNAQRRPDYILGRLAKGD